MPSPTSSSHAIDSVPDPLVDDVFRDQVRRALEEDVGEGDATSLATLGSDRSGCGRMLAGEPMVLCGIGVATEVFHQVCPEIKVHHTLKDGMALSPQEAVLEVSGPASALLTAERVALNFVQRLSGIATLTSRFVQAVEGTPVRILDTRKTTPGWRLLEKYAVRCGGGTNHRFGLYDMVMIKDNHLAALSGASPNPVAAAVSRVRKQYPTLRIEVEADTLEQVQWAAEAGADVVLLDNMNLDDLRAAVQVVGERCQTEASGGVSLESVRSIAETGVDFISVGALTHSARALDLGFEMMTEETSG